MKSELLSILIGSCSVCACNLIAMPQFQHTPWSIITRLTYHWQHYFHTAAQKITETTNIVTQLQLWILAPDIIPWDFGGVQENIISEILGPCNSCSTYLSSFLRIVSNHWTSSSSDPAVTRSLLSHSSTHQSKPIVVPWDNERIIILQLLLLLITKKKKKKKKWIITLASWYHAGVLFLDQIWSSRQDFGRLALQTIKTQLQSCLNLRRGNCNTVLVVGESHSRA